MKLSLFNTLTICVFFGFQLSQSVLASDNADWCNSLEVTNCSNDYAMRICSYDGDDSVHLASVQDSKVNSGSTGTFKCNHENCDLGAAVMEPSDTDSCVSVLSNYKEVFNADSCDQYYIDFNMDNERWSSSKSGCP